MADSPFILEALPSKDGYYVLAQEYGRHEYMKINCEKIANSNEQMRGKAERKEITVTEFPSGGCRKIITYTLKWNPVGGPQLYRNETDPSGRISNFPVVYYQSRYIRLGYSTYRLTKPISGVSDYLQLMSAEVTRLNKEADDKTLYLRRLLAYHLYGFSDQANDLGFSETREKAKTIAGSVVPYYEYRNVLAERVDPVGKFRLTEGDMAYLKPEVKNMASNR